MATYTTLRMRLRTALSRLYPGVSFDLEWIKEPDHQWHEGDDLIDHWHLWWRRVGQHRHETYTPITTTGGDEIPF